MGSSFKTKGKLILECPNLISACEEFLKDPEAGASPNQRTKNNVGFLWRSKVAGSSDGSSMGLHSKSLAALLHNCGLTN